MIPDGVGRLLMLAGAVLLALGVLFTFAGKVPWLGRLPGDISIQREHFSVYIPITTSLLLSALVSLVLWLWRR